MPLKARGISSYRWVSLFLADLITYRARSFASGLAGSLAFATAAGVNRCLQGCFVYRNNTFCHADSLLRHLVLVLL